MWMCYLLTVIIIIIIIVIIIIIIIIIIINYRVIKFSDFAAFVWCENHVENNSVLIEVFKLQLMMHS